MQLKKNRSVLQNFYQASQCEWLETNGLGGWASSSIIGCNTRRYHGLLVAAIVPPAERMAMVSKLDETIVISNERFELSVNNYGGVIHPNGHLHQTSFTKDLFPRFTYEIGGISLKKTVAMVHGENTTLVIYDVIKSDQPFILELLPLFSVRGYHSLMRANDAVYREAGFSNDVFKAKLYDGTPEIFIKAAGARYEHNPNWYFHFNYETEKSRGLDFVEDLFTTGYFDISLKEGDSLGIIISTDDPSEKDAHELLAKEQSRKRELLKDQPRDEILHQLLLAADQFIVQRDEDLKTVIAGYHWFTDWGRDTMISLPGLCLSTGRFNDAKKILSAFAKTISQGMLPNRFQDNGQPPEYNNVDGTLWYFIAIYKYLGATNDQQFVLNELLPALKEIIEWHFRGSRYHIRVTEDGLLFAGEPGVQLTWMDSKIGDWVVTPRTGKAVEINALWYNALLIYASLLELDGNSNEAIEMKQKAILARRSFNDQFWDRDKGYLYDFINNDKKDDSLRPNQLFAISLPFSLLEKTRATSIIKAVTEKLYTPVGLRSLSPDDASYIPCYEGDSFKRDSSYHQGTVWSWLLGAYVDALVKTGTEKPLIQNVIQNFAYHLNEGCIGSVSEIFDADGPHLPRGCMAQAWGVAEILRVIKDHDLVTEQIIKPKERKIVKDNFV
ncbi:MAG TPA: amylo-alpha-1,6-glucosidase [Chitinophagaceae bacterium]|nr:amylo-alpha-1,6-glucosidase [Chitinophagaceae bacterium]